MQRTLYNLTKIDVIKLFNSFNNDTNNLALLFYNKGKAKSIDSAIKKVIKLKKFANETE